MPDTYTLVQSHYGEIAKRNTTSPTTQQTKEENVAKSFGYTADDLASLPDKTNLGLSCGNPVGLANVKEGETILDLGSGAGIDVFLAAKKVGEKGRAIGVDMTRDMITLATTNAQKANLANTSFLESRITSVPLPDSTVDCIISNCVINLVPAGDKPSVFREIFRLLKSGGRVAVSDILARKPLPESISGDMALYVGCVAGASLVREYEGWLAEAGFKDVLIVDAKSDLNVYKTLEPGSCCGSSGCSTSTKVDSSKIDFNEWAGSFQIYAIKP
ncbi:hypothetical protein SI65_04414 [Aspergillus cristatus]|uniref:Arsenite methyltransferase n=1 Tax=Aspergillus cristatus TaxID=573508 RepID=A0A1E3BEN9_ASPCR|nr:hypothetical protein SI65_04414 [Aspergillus cristatus]